MLIERYLENNYFDGEYVKLKTDGAVSAYLQKLILYKIQAVKWGMAQFLCNYYEVLLYF